MTRITCTCPTCGTVGLELDELVVVADARTDAGWYAFDCYGCGRQVVTAVPGTVIAALTLLRIPVRPLPAEVIERARTRAVARPIGFDDLLDLMLWLQAHDDLALGAPAGRTRRR